MTFSRVSKSRVKLRLNVEQYPVSGTYFITISCFENQHKFGHIEHGKMILNDYGEIAMEKWHTIFDRFPNAENVVVQIMPNHFHAMLHVYDISRNDRMKLNSEIESQDSYSKLNQKMKSRSYPIPAISEIIGAYKSIVTLACLEKFKTDFKGSQNIPHMGKIWHRSFWERIVRNNREFENVKKYIENNPINWSAKTNGQKLK